MLESCMCKGRYEETQTPAPVPSCPRAGPARPRWPADPCGGLLTLSPAHCAAHRSRRWGLMPADIDTMATRTGREGMVASAGARLHAGLGHGGPRQWPSLWPPALAFGLPCCRRPASKPELSKPRREEAPVCVPAG